MISSDFRDEARRKLSGKWGKLACITLIYILISSIFSFIEKQSSDSVSFIISIIFTIINVPLGFGFTCALFKIFHNEEVGTFDFFSLGFGNFKKSWAIAWRTFLKLLVPFILMIVSFVLIGFATFGTVSSALYASSAVSGFGALTIIGFILLIVSTIWCATKSYYYSLTYFLSFENSDLTAKELVEKSAELMNGKRGNLFILQLSFIGWAILGIFTLGIGFLWLLPYMNFATIAFYKFVSSSHSNVEAKVVTENNDNPIQGE